MGSALQIPSAAASAGESDINCSAMPALGQDKLATLVLSDAQSALMGALVANVGFPDLRAFMTARLEGKFDYQLRVLEDKDEALQANPQLGDQFSAAAEKISLSLREGQRQVRIPLTDLFGQSDTDRASLMKLVPAVLVDAGYDPVYSRSGRFDIYERAGQKELVLSGYQQDAESQGIFTLLKMTREIEQSVFFPEGSDAPLLRQSANTCYRHSAFYALAQHPVGQEILKGMIHPVDQQNFVVQFPGVPSTKIEVSLSELKPQDGSLEYTDIRPYVSGSLGTKIISLAYSKLERVINDAEKFSYNASDGGDASLVLRRYTGWDSIWFTNSGELLKFNPQSIADYPEKMKEAMEFPYLSPLYERNPGELGKFDGVYKLLRDAAENPERFMLVAGSRQYIVPHDNPHNFTEAHAFAITRIEKVGEGMVIELVDPKDTAKAPVRLNEIEFIKCFRKISGVMAP